MKMGTMTTIGVKMKTRVPRLISLHRDFDDWAESLKAKHPQIESLLYERKSTPNRRTPLVEIGGYRQEKDFYTNDELTIEITYKTGRVVPYGLSRHRTSVSKTVSFNVIFAHLSKAIEEAMERQRGSGQA